VKQLIAGYIEGKPPDIGVGEGTLHARVPPSLSFKKLKYDPHLSCTRANQQDSFGASRLVSDRNSPIMN
jgi:hypothetical protein